MKIIEQYEDLDSKSESINVSDAKYIGDFAIRLTFNDGHKQLVDFKPFLEQALNPTIKRYLDEEHFKEFKIVDGNLDWNDFELCFPISDLYENNILKKEKKPVDQ